MKARSIFINIKASRFFKRFDHFNVRFNRFINKSSLKTNACSIKDSAIVKNHVDACTSKNDLTAKNHIDACTNTDDLIAKNYVSACTSKNDLTVKNYVDACTNTDDLIAKNYVNACTNTDDLVKNHADACTNTDDVCTNENEPPTNVNDPFTNVNEPCTNNDDSDDDSDDIDDSDDVDHDSDDDSNNRPGSSDSNNKPGSSGSNKKPGRSGSNNKPGSSDSNNKPGSSGNKNNNNDNKPSENDKKDNKLVNKKSHQISPSELFSNNIAKIIKLIDELENDEIFDNDDEWLVLKQLNMINPLLNELIDQVWSTIHNKNRENNEIINIDIDKDKDIEDYVNIYKKIIDDKFEFVNKKVELYNNAIDKKELNNLKDDVLKLIDNSCVCDVERKGSKKNNNEKISDAKRKGRKKDNNKNVNKNKDNLIYKSLNNKDKLHNFRDKVLNNLTDIAKLKQKILIKKKEAGELNVPLKNIKLKLDKYKKINILDELNHVWIMIFGKNRVNNEMDNIDCNIVEDAKTYVTKYIKIVSDKQVLIYSVSESIDELMEGLP